jgi:hypothetical protein
LEVVEDQGVELALGLQLALDQVGAPARAGGPVGYSDAFCPAQPVVGCRFGEPPRTWRTVFLDGRRLLLLSFSLRSLRFSYPRSGLSI